MLTRAQTCSAQMRRSRMSSSCVMAVWCLCVRLPTGTRHTFSARMQAMLWLRRLSMQTATIVIAPRCKIRCWRRCHAKNFGKPFDQTQTCQSNGQRIWPAQFNAHECAPKFAVYGQFQTGWTLGLPNTAQCPAKGCGRVWRTNCRLAVRRFIESWPAAENPSHAVGCASNGFLGYVRAMSSE